MGRTGLVRLGFVGSVAYPLIPDVVGAFRAAYPEVEVRLRELTTSEQLEALAAGALDVGFARSPLAAAGVEVEPIAHEAILAALPSGHPLAGLAEVSLAALSTEPFVLFSRAQAPGFFDDLVDRVAATGTPPRIIQEAREMQTIMALVASGLGVSLVPESASALGLRGIAYRPIAGRPMTGLVLVRRSGATDPAVAAFREIAISSQN